MGEEVLLVGENELNFIPKEYENKKNVNLRFYIEVGTLEGNMMIKGSRDLRDILISKGCSIEYSEFPGGHDYLHWKETLAKGLMFLANQGKYYLKLYLTSIHQVATSVTNSVRSTPEV